MNDKTEVELILEYTKKEGGDWYTWPESIRSVPTEIDLNRMKHSAGYTFLSSVKFHAFRTSYGRVWDCIKGWREANYNEAQQSTQDNVKSAQLTIPIAVSKLLSPAEQYTVLKTYLQVKVQNRDWHGVCDAAMDIRELVAKYPGVESNFSSSLVTKGIDTARGRHLICTDCDFPERCIHFGSCVTSKKPLHKDRVV